MNAPRRAAGEGPRRAETLGDAPASPAAPTRRWRGALLATTALTLGATALATSGTFASYTAKIVNNANKSTASTLMLTTSDGTTTCSSSSSTTNAATCSVSPYTTTTITPSSAYTSTITVTNTGNTATKTLTITPGTCTESGNMSTQPTTLCSVLNLVLYRGADTTGTQIYSGTLAAFTSTLTEPNLAAGASQPYTFAISLPANTDPAFGDLVATEPITFAATG